MDDPVDIQFWLLVGAIGATYLWRGLGVLLASRIDPEGPVFQWVTCVSYAMLSGLIARMVFIPVGPLAEVPLSYRLIGLGAGLATFFLAKRQVLPGVGAGLIVFVLLASLG